MPPKKTKLIVNPIADLGRAWRTATNLKPLIDELGGADWAGTVYPGHACELARQAAEDGYELLVACGGDGTVHEVINGLMQVPPDHRPRLGVVPLGSGNDFSYSIGMSSDFSTAVQQVFTCSPRRVDIGVMRDGINHEIYWSNAVGIGFDTIVTIYSRQFSYLRGFLIYLAAVLKTIILNHDAPLLKIKADGETWEDNYHLFVACNGSREGGGFKIHPEARPDDGIFHYAAVRHVSRLMMLRLLPEVMNGTHGRFPQVRMGQFRKMEIQADRPLYLHTDGEIIYGFKTDMRRLELEIIPGALEVVAPEGSSPGSIAPNGPLP